MEISPQGQKARMEADPLIEKPPATSTTSCYRTSLKVVAIVGVVLVLLVRLSPTCSRTENGKTEGLTTSSIATAIFRIISDAKWNDDVNIIETKKRPIKVACVGDSITYRGCVTDANDTYVSQLAHLLGPDYEVANYGNSGKTMLKKGICCREEKTWPCSYWDTVEFNNALRSAPDIVTIMLGTNDAKRCNWYGPPDGNPKGYGIGYVMDYLEMVEFFWALPSAPIIYLAIPPPLVHPPKHPDQPEPFGMDGHVINHDLRELIPSIAKEFGLKFRTSSIGIIDVWSALGGKKGYQNSSMTCDGCHPEKDAFAIIAREFASAITSRQKNLLY